jgi:hypothetical protein
VTGSKSTSINAPPQLVTDPTAVNFGNVAIGNSSTQTILLTNPGSASLTISQATVSSASFSISGLTLPLALSPGQTTAVSVQFTPRVVGSVTGSISLVSTASNTSTIVALSGAGVQAVPHSVSLSWNPSSSVVAGYNVYRGTQTGGPYAKLNSAPIPGTGYTDSAVQSGQTYFYVATAVDANNVESVFSNEASATIPIP